MSEISLQNGMEMRQGLTQAMLQNLGILQAPVVELRQMVSQAVSMNPVLEEAPESDEDSRIEEWEDDEWGGDIDFSRRDREMEKHDFLINSLVAQERLSDYLMTQLVTSAIDQKLKQATEYLIGSLDVRGFLESSLEELAEASGLPLALLKKGLTLLRSFDPPGVGAFDLKDCLKLQLEREGLGESNAMLIVSSCLEDLARRRYDRIGEHLSLSLEEVEQAAAAIARLNPDPGSAFDTGENRDILPDLEIMEREGEWTVRLARGSEPLLKLNDVYKETLAGAGSDHEVRSYLKRCFQEARQLIQALDMRRETLLKLGAFLLERQKSFFLYGPEYLQPLGMTEAADVLGVHPATISRAVAGKYVKCAQGVYELRFFFSSGYRNEKGVEVSSHAVRETIARLVAGEDASSPLSDSDIAEKLGDMGLTVARRTVAKYREQMNIPPSSQRRKRF